MAVRPGALESMVDFWHGKRVLVTGHTGFKGAWLSLWLLERGAHVTGIALPPETRPSLFEQLNLASRIDHHELDIRDGAALRRLVIETAPDIVFHLAAQALVLRSYRTPEETWAINVMGTLNVLESLRALEGPTAAVMVTTDKVYENEEWEFAYRESDPLGGHDPYSASKAAMEILVSSWRRSFLIPEGRRIRVATARAGNVIGGGDWAENRILPDIARALAAGEPVRVRNPHAVRPWQHVLEPLSGYMLLAERLYENDDATFQDAFNFGPAAGDERTVREVVEEALKHWPGRWEDASTPGAPHEAGRLALTADRARLRLGWRPRWDFATAITETIGWYRAALEGDVPDITALTRGGLQRFETVCAREGEA